MSALTPADFAGLLARGSGRAHLILESDHTGVYDDVLVAECLRNDPYDYQLEGGRAQYLHELADLAGVTDRVASALVEALDGDDDYHIDYRFDMGAILAREAKPGTSSKPMSPRPSCRRSCSDTKELRARCVATDSSRV